MHGLLPQDKTKRDTAKQWAANDSISRAAQRACGLQKSWCVAVLSAPASPPSLDPVSNSLNSGKWHNCVLARHVILHNIYSVKVRTVAKPNYAFHAGEKESGSSLKRLDWSKITQRYHKRVGRGARGKREGRDRSRNCHKLTPFLPNPPKKGVGERQGLQRTVCVCVRACARARASVYVCAPARVRAALQLSVHYMPSFALLLHLPPSFSIYFEVRRHLT